MIKHIATFILSLTFVLSQANGQKFKKQFDKLLENNDTIGQFDLLKKWEKSDSKDPELYVAYFNFYLNKSRTEVIAMGDTPKGEDALQIMNNDSSKNEAVGFLYSDIHYDPKTLSIGFDWINKGIENHPNRLDMRFGKIYLYGELEDYGNFTNEIIKTIVHSTTNDNKWTWGENKPVDEPKEFMLKSIQDYQIQLFNTGSKDNINNVKKIAETILRYYADHIESLSNLSVVFMIQNQYDKAIEALTKAEVINPKDAVVLGNMARAYRLKGDTKNAIKYFELVLKYGDKKRKEFAKQQIKELEKK